MPLQILQLMRRFWSYANYCKRKYLDKVEGLGGSHPAKMMAMNDFGCTDRHREVCILYYPEGDGPKKKKKKKKRKKKDRHSMSWFRSRDLLIVSYDVVGEIDESVKRTSGL
jgi:hypothetical protein